MQLLQKMTDKRILLVTQEINPYLPETHNSRLGRELPKELFDRGYEVRTFMPKFGQVNERRNQLHEVIRLSGMNISINDSDHPLIIKVSSLQPARIQVYFIDNDDFFQRCDDDVDPVGSNRADNDERAIFFARGTMETVKKLRWEPSVIQCQGWITALAPMYLRKMYAADASFRGSKIIYSIAEGEPTGCPDAELLRKLRADGLDDADLAEFKDDKFNADTLHKLAIKFSDGVIITTDKVSDDVLAYMEKLGRPVLPYAEASESYEAYHNFYKLLVDKK